MPPQIINRKAARPRRIFPLEKSAPPFFLFAPCIIRSKPAQIRKIYPVSPIFPKKYNKRTREKNKSILI